jgi:hypothetical protein
MVVGSGILQSPRQTVECIFGQGLLETPVNNAFIYLFAQNVR